MENSKVISQHISNVSNELLQLDRDQVLATTLEDIRNLYSIIQHTMSQNYLCVVGNETKITEDQDVFKTIKHLHI
jgi:Zn-dependent M16 (insulinase) family peptidase